MSEIVVRSATPSDAAVLLEIYRPFVVGSAASFELVTPSVEEFRHRIEESLTGWAWLVAERADRVVAYAYATPHRARPAYRWSVEPSVYVQADCHRLGIGSALYGALLSLLAEKGFCNAYAGIALPNEASLALHERVGFKPVGIFKSVGWKFGKWHDVSWWHLPMRPLPPGEDS